jgi:twitching motility protein PilT
MHIDDLLKRVAREGASDLHLKPMRAPMLRVRGKLQPIEGDPLPPAVLREMLGKVLTEKQCSQLDENYYLDFGYSLGGVARFRGAAYYQRGTLAAVFRRIPFVFPSLEEWELPEVLRELAALPQGLVLLAGPSGAGKSSTLAALMREILETRLVHVVTIEDPIEFLLTDHKGSVSQREVGTDTHSYEDALHNTLRQDPDVIMVGEMRDVGTMATALTAAETGHLVFSTVHANSSAQTIDRLVDAFPESQHRQIRLQLSQVLQGIIALQLVERADGSGMVAAVEILRHNPKISRLIAEGKTAEIHDEMEKSVTFERMQTLNQSLVALVLNGTVTREAAAAASPSPGEFALELRQFLHAAPQSSEGDAMPDSSADFSKIMELREVRRLYEEAQERFRQEMTDKDSHIRSLQSQLDMQDTLQDTTSVTKALQEERDKLAQQLAFQRQEYETKIEKLQHRIKELTSPAAESRLGGIFRR